MIKKIFNYLEPLWTGEDGKISLRSTASIALLIDFISNLSHSVYKWDAGRSLEGLSLVLGIEGGLIASLLGITAWSNMTAKKIDSISFSPSPITVENATTVVNSGSKVDTVNAKNVETVNSETTNIERINE